MPYLRGTCPIFIPSAVMTSEEGEVGTRPELNRVPMAECTCAISSRKHAGARGEVEEAA